MFKCFVIGNFYVIWNNSNQSGAKKTIQGRLCPEVVSGQWSL